LAVHGYLGLDGIAPHALRVRFTGLLSSPGFYGYQGRYRHEVDQHPAPLDPNFTGLGRCLTDDDGNYRFTTIKPGPYPWRNHDKAWRPAHIHFSLFGTAFASRLITQMYFPGDPLFAYDAVMKSVTDERARQRMVSSFDLDTTVSEWATGYRWDIVLRGPEKTLFEDVEEDRS
jgi:protocatechuate 3,4-dioxygenase, beta subunit